MSTAKPRQDHRTTGENIGERMRLPWKNKGALRGKKEQTAGLFALVPGSSCV